MSRQIANDHLWSDEEVQYMLDRHRVKDVERNRAEFSGQKPEEIAPEQHSVNLDQDIFVKVNGLELEQLRSELKKLDLDLTGDVPTLKKRLAQALQEVRDAGGDSNS